jgi:penicillin-binding protein 1A
LSRRQPGSAVKPIFSYAPAMEENIITPGSTIDDAPFVRGNWEPENFDQRFRGLVTVREALVRSLNVPAIKTFAQITPKIGLEYAERMGISSIHPDDYNLASAIGGMTYGVTAFDMAQAFGVLANQGIKTKLHTVQRIEDVSGNVIYEYGNEPVAVLSPKPLTWSPIC